MDVFLCVYLVEAELELRSPLGYISLNSEVKGKRGLYAEERKRGA